MTKVDQSFNNRSVTVPVGGMLELDLKENPTTGYRWTLTGPGTPVCELKTDDFVPAGRALGAGGTRSFTFAIRQAGEATLSLSNVRSFGGADAAGGFTLHVRATN